MKDSWIPLPHMACGALTIFLGTALGFLTLATGCGSSTVQKTIDKAKEATKQATQSVTQQVTNSVQNATRPTATSFEITIENVAEPLKVSTGKADVAVLENRPIAVNFTTTPGRDTASFPNVLVSIQGTGKTFADLVGKTHPARIFIQVKQAQPMYTTQRDKPAQVTIEAGDETYVRAKFEKAELFDSSGQETIFLSGKLEGLIPQPPKPVEDKKKAGDK